MSIKKGINKIFEKEEDLPLEHRLFFSVIIIGILVSIIGSLINLVLKASLPAIIIPLSISVLLSTFYYLLKVKRIFEPLILPAIIISYVGISIIWVFNGGIKGSNIMPAFVILILGLTIVSEKMKKYVIILFISLFITIYLFELFHPELIINYTSETDQWVDSFITFLYSSFFIFLIIRFIHKHYTLEKIKATESEAKYRMLTESMKDVVWTLDSETLKYTYISPSVQKLRGYSPDEIMSEPINVAFTREESSHLYSLMAQRINELMTKNDNHPIYYTDEVLQPCKDGTTVWTEEIHEYYVNEKNDRVELRGVTRDISERKRDEQQIKLKNEELFNLNAEKDKFFSIIAHDLKSPFHSIIGLSEFLVKKVKEKELDGIEKYADNIRLSSHKVMDLLTNLMLWSLSQTGRMHFRPDDFELKPLIDEVSMLFAETTENKSIILKKEIPSTIKVYADKAMVSTILRNLISNAIKFSYSGGVIIITAFENEDGLTVQVSDSGVGIPEESIYKLFRIDQNYSTPGTQKEQGTGLGLILCREFVDKHGGDIWVKSNSDSKSGAIGSTFYFTIPFKSTLKSIGFSN